MRLVLERPNDVITIRGNNEDCDLFSNCVPTPTVEFSVGGGHVGLDFHRVELIPQLRDDGSYASFGIDEMDMTSPEPASAALLAIGAACAAAKRRFRRLYV